MATATGKRSDDSGSGAGLLGSLAHTPLAEVFRRIVRQELSGDLQVTIPNAIKTVYFDRGFVVFASSNLKSDRLGESMIEAGRLSRHEFALASMLVKNTKRKFGQVLVDAGIVADEELGRYVAAQVNRIVLSLFSAKKGVYSFDERPTGIPVELMVSLSSYRILIEGVRRMSRKSLVFAGLPPLETRIELTSHPPFSLDVDKLHDAEKRVLKAVGEGKTIREVVDQVGGNEGVALRACYGLLCGGVLEAETPDARARLLRVQEETGTFVLSEIRQKVTKKADESAGAPSPSPTPAPLPPLEPVSAEITIVESPDQQPEPQPSPMADSAPLPPVSPAENERRQAPQPTFGAEPTESGGVIAWLTSLLEAVLRFFGKLFGAVEAPPEDIPSVESPERRPRSQPQSAAPEPPPVVIPPPAAKPTAPDEPPTMDSIGVPSWSMKDPATEEPPVDGSVGAPSWSMRDDPADEDTAVTAETLGTPRWSMKDDPSEPKPKRRAKPVKAKKASPVEPTPPGPPPAPAPSAFESRPAPQSERTPEPQPQPEPEPVAASVTEPEASPESELTSTMIDATLNDLDNELFIEDASDDDVPSMLSQIPVETVALEEEGIEIEVEIDEESLLELAESESAEEPKQPESVTVAPDASPAEVETSEERVEPEEPPRVAASAGDEVATSASDAPAEEESAKAEASAAATRAREMNRIKQSGGENRLLRDVKLHFRMRDWAGAVPLLQQLVEISPGKALYRGMLARAMSRHPGLRKEAEEHFVEALRLSPQDPELHYWLGIYYKSFGLTARATTEFRTTLRINPKHEGARKQLFGDGKKDDALGAVMKKLFG